MAKAGVHAAGSESEAARTDALVAHIAHLKLSIAREKKSRSERRTDAERAEIAQLEKLIADAKETLARSRRGKQPALGRSLRRTYAVVGGGLMVLGAANLVGAWHIWRAGEAHGSDVLVLFATLGIPLYIGVGLVLRACFARYDIKKGDLTGEFLP